MTPDQLAVLHCIAEAAVAAERTTGYPIRNLQNGVWTPMFARTGERSSHSRRKRADQAQDVCVAQRPDHLPGGDVRMHPAVSGP
jgi:hypothetical protein